MFPCVALRSPGALLLRSLPPPSSFLTRTCGDTLLSANRLLFCSPFFLLPAARQTKMFRACAVSEIHLNRLILNPLPLAAQDYWIGKKKEGMDSWSSELACTYSSSTHNGHQTQIQPWFLNTKLGQGIPVLHSTHPPKCKTSRVSSRRRVENWN